MTAKNWMAAVVRTSPWLRMIARMNNWTTPERNGQKAGSNQAFSLVEVMVVMGLLTVLIFSSLAGIASMDSSSRRLADHTAGMSVVEAKINAIRAASYNPPTAPFGSSTVNLTNNTSIALWKSGTNYLVSGVIVSKIQPIISGHLVTVTGTFFESPKYFSITLQTVINRYTTGEQ